MHPALQLVSFNDEAALQIASEMTRVHMIQREQVAALSQLYSRRKSKSQD